MLHKYFYTIFILFYFLNQKKYTFVCKTPTKQPTSAQQSKLNFKWLLFFCIVLLFYITPQVINAQCTPHTADAGNGFLVTRSANELQGQTFLACADGEITSVSIGFISPSGAGTYELYLAIDPGNGMPITPTPVASIMQAGAFGPSLTFNLNNPFPVLDDGTLYRLAVTNTTNNFAMRVNVPSDYADGDFVNRFNNYNSDFDLDFEVNIQPPSSSNPTSVPTLSQWGLIILALLLMTLGTLYLVQPNWRGRFEQER